MENSLTKNGIKILYNNKIEEVFVQILEIIPSKNKDMSKFIPYIFNI